MRHPQGMFWCIDCNAWRTLPECRVCRMRALWLRWVGINDDLLALLPDTIAEKFSHSQTTPETLELRPPYPQVSLMGKTQRRAALKDYDKALERYDFMVYARLYDGEKHLAQRVRRLLTDEN